MKASLRFTSILLMVMLIAGFAPVTVVSADIGPMPAPPGSAISTNGMDTMVQMVYEQVYITIREDSVTTDIGTPYEQTYPISDAAIGAHFVMQNQGDDPETVHIGFPLQERIEEDTIENIIIRVNGEVIETVTETLSTPAYFEADSVPWATFDVTFLPGEPVNIDVEYKLDGMWYGNVTIYEYLLETGAGWYGKIQDGDVILEMPYKATYANVVVNGLAAAGVQAVYTDNLITWSFHDVEPTVQDNVTIEVVHPSDWRDLMALESQFAADPTNCDFILALGNKYMELSHDFHGYPRYDLGGRDLLTQGLAKYSSYQQYCSSADPSQEHLNEILRYIITYNFVLDNVYYMPQEAKDILEKAIQDYPELIYYSGLYSDGVTTYEDLVQVLYYSPEERVTRQAPQTVTSAQTSRNQSATQTAVRAMMTPQPAPILQMEEPTLPQMAITETATSAPGTAVSTPDNGQGGNDGIAMGWLAIPALLVVGGMGFLYLKKKQP